MASEQEKKIETYLSKLRTGLRGMNDEEARDIVEELRSHILEKGSADGGKSIECVDAALAGLGDPMELANRYITDNALCHAEGSSSPAQVLDSLFRWASISVAGFLVLVGTLIGYFLGSLFALLGVLKLFHPHTAGLWASRDSSGDLGLSFRLGFGSAPVGAKDVLGWWIVPIGLLAGGMLVILTTWFGSWCARQYRKSRKLRQQA